MADGVLPRRRVGPLAHAAPEREYSAMAAALLEAMADELPGGMALYGEATSRPSPAPRA